MPEEPDKAGVLPPHDLDAEQSLLGAMLINHSALALAARMTDPEDFYRADNREIFETIVRLAESGSSVDPVTVTDALKKRRRLTAVGGKEKLHALSEFCPAATAVRDYARAVHDSGIRRRVIRACQEIETDARGEGGEVQALLESAEERIFGVATHQDEEATKTMPQLASEAMRRIEIASLGMSTGGMRTGFDTLDKIIGGLQPKTLTILAARPSVGKTSFACNMAERVARSEGGVGFFSLEMSASEVFDRMISTLARVSSHKVREGSITPDEVAGLVGAMGQLEQLPIFIDETPGLTILQLRQKARRLKARGSLKLIIVDYLQLLAMGDGNRGEQRVFEVSRISRALKQVAREVGVPLLCLSQLSRNSENREDKRPRLSDLRDSGAIEQDADMVIFLHDERQDPSAKGLMEVIVAKNRTGPRGTVRLTFTPEWTRFQDLPAGSYLPDADGDSEAGVADHHLHRGYVAGMDDPEDREEQMAHAVQQLPLPGEDGRDLVAVGVS